MRPLLGRRALLRGKQNTDLLQLVQDRLKQLMLIWTGP
jgi:hypothetical protein